MNKKPFLSMTLAIALSTSGLISSFSTPASADAFDDQQAQRFEFRHDHIKHVLLLSIDGMHAVDLANYVKANPGAALAEFAHHGITYTNASATRPSDSFPGLLAQITGGTPNATGVFYDDSYDRSLSAPGSNCATVGTEVVYDESIDKDPNAIDGGGGIDPAALPLDPAKGCTPVYPHNYLRVNTVFEVIKHAGGRTAWSDKHPAYEIVQGPSGQGVDDLYTPEVAANGDATTSLAAIKTYDDLKVQAILNEIDGLDHTGTMRVGVPTIFGMNFQGISVGQKLAGNGYLDAQATPSAGLADTLNHTDASLRKMLNALKSRDLSESTLVIISAKHGQSPIDPRKTKIVNKDLIPGLVNGVQSGLLAQATQDDVSLIWLMDQTRADDVVSALSANQDKAGIQQIFSGESLKLRFNDPALDPRVPDVIVQPNLGVIYAKTTATKIAEHGGFAEPDLNVVLLVSNPDLPRRTIKSPVQTTQIAPTILKQLGLDPEALQAVRRENTRVLPGL